MLELAMALKSEYARRCFMIFTLLGGRVKRLCSTIKRVKRKQVEVDLSALARLDHGREGGIFFILLFRLSALKVRKKTDCLTLKTKICWAYTVVLHAIITSQLSLRSI